MIDIKKLALWCTALAVVCVSFFVFRSYERHEGAKDARIAVLTDSLQHSLAALSKQADSLEAKFKPDTIKQTKVIQNYDSARKVGKVLDSIVIAHRSPTILHDTLYVPATVVAQADTAIQKADSVVRYCRIVEADCEKGWQTERQRTTTLTSENALLRKQIPSGLRAHLSITAGDGCTLNSGKVLCGPSAIAGWKLWP